MRRSGPPGFVVLLTLIAGAAGGAWLGEKVTHNAVAALEASTAAARGEGGAAQGAAPDDRATPPHEEMIEKTATRVLDGATDHPAVRARADCWS